MRGGSMRGGKLTPYRGLHAIYFSGYFTLHLGRLGVAIPAAFECHRLFAARWDSRIVVGLS